MRSWEEQRDEICRLNDLCLVEAESIISGTGEIIKGYAKDGSPYYSTILDGMEMLARCSNIAKQWTAELRQAEPVQGNKPTAEPSDDQLARKAKRA